MIVLLENECLLAVKNVWNFLHSKTVGMQKFWAQMLAPG